MKEWALFCVSDPIITLMRFGHFTRFFTIARIGKMGQNWGFRGLRSQFETIPDISREGVWFGDIWVFTSRQQSKE